MSDRTSQYRQLRLILNPSEISDHCAWSVVAMRVVKGVPHSKVLDSGVIRGGYDVSTDEGIVQLIGEVARRYEARWMLHP